MSWGISFGNDCPHNCPLDGNSEEGKYQYVTHSSKLTTPNDMDVMGLTIIGDFGGHLGLKGRKRRISWSPKVNCNCELYTNRCDLFHSFHSIVSYITQRNPFGHFSDKPFSPGMTIPGRDKISMSNYEINSGFEAKIKLNNRNWWKCRSVNLNPRSIVKYCQSICWGVTLGRWGLSEGGAG